MRTKLLILILGISLNSFAQDSILFENSWYLQDLIINNESNLPPTNDEVQNILLEFFSDNNFASYVCEALGGIVVFDNVNNNFTFSELSETLGGGCEQTPNFIYEGLYFSFYFNNVDNPFGYSILINGDDSKTLTITSSNGDQAIYGSEILSIEDKSKSNFSLFYSKFRNSIDINSNDFSGNFSITLFDIHGKSVFDLNEYISGKKSISIQNLPNGIYFVLLQNEIGEILIKKILKY